MLFNSYIFVFLFLPAALAGYYIGNHLRMYRWADIFLIGISLWFYGYFNPSYLVIICGSIVLNYGLSKCVGGIKSRLKKQVLILGICINIVVIFYFKYYDFFIENINFIFRKSFQLKNVMLPLGISFFTFQQISYLVDSYNGQTRDYTFVEYALFVVFFPQLVAGPIVLHKEMIPQFRDRGNRRFIPQNFSKALYLFAIGLFKKVILADTFGRAVTWGFGIIETLSSMEALLVSFSYTFQLYFDFSGYCDMAVGIGAMFNIELPQNFNSPYKAASITEFWDRWHMSLTRFLRTYIYIPLGGNRKGKIRTYGNVMIVYLISGIWHGANWTFLLWGMLHGLFCCLNRIFKDAWEKLGKVTQWAVTFMLVNMLWVLFRAESLASAQMFLLKLGSFSDFTIRENLYEVFDLEELLFLEKSLPIFHYLHSEITSFHLWLFVFGAFFIVLNFQNSKEKEFRPTVRNSLLTILFLLWSVTSFAGISAFLYFDF